jgi:hypothetical protein
MFCALGLIFDSIEGDGSRFRPYRGRRVPFSCFALLDSFSAAPRVASPFFIFCAPELIFNGTGCDVSRFHILRSRTRFWQYRGRRILFSKFALPDSISTVSRASGPVLMFCTLGLFFGSTEGVGSRFHVLRARTRFRRYQGRPVPFSCFALLDVFLAV